MRARNNSRNVCNKNQFILFSLKIKTSCFLQFLGAQTYYNKCCKLSKSWKNTRKNKAYFMLQTLHNEHNVMEITLWTLWLNDFYYSKSFGRNKYFMKTNLFKLNKKSHPCLQCFFFIFAWIDHSQENKCQVNTLNCRLFFL